eukprot:706601-Prymnesium_polylepis.1
MDHLHATRAFDPAPLHPSPTSYQRQRPRGPRRPYLCRWLKREYAACHLPHVDSLRAASTRGAADGVGEPIARGHTTSTTR